MIDQVVEFPSHSFVGACAQVLTRDCTCQFARAYACTEVHARVRGRTVGCRLPKHAPTGNHGVVSMGACLLVFLSTRACVCVSAGVLL